MSTKLEIPTVDSIIDGELEAIIGVHVNDVIGTSYAQYQDRLKNNATNENGTLMPEAVIVNAAGIDVDCLYVTDEDEEQQYPDLEALHTAMLRMRSDYRDHKDFFLAHNIDIEPLAILATQMGDGTERNLEHYYADQLLHYNSDGLENYAAMLRGWTAQEKNHSPVLWLVSRAIGIYDERAMTVIQNELINGGIEVQTRSFPAIGAFTQPQERLTYASHTNNGLLVGKSGQAGIRPVAGQEIMHEGLFGRNNEHYFTFDQDITDYSMQIFAAVWASLKMPASKSYPNFGKVSMLLSHAGLFTHEMLVESLKRSAVSLDILGVEVRSDEAKAAQDNIAQLIDINSDHNQAIVKRMESYRQRHNEKIKEQGRIPFVLEKTVTFETGVPHVHPEAA